MARYKFRGDYILAKIFADYIKGILQKINPDFFVPIPLSEERLYERGFNQAEALLTVSGFTPSKILTRAHSEKQSKKSRTERIHIPQVFQIDDQRDLIGKKVLLIDDIYTTGSTLRHAAKLLKKAGAKRVQSLTLAR
jgi:competence protein ComFC